MQNYLKFLRKLPKNLREKLIRAVDKIGNDELEGLDIKPVQGTKDVYRCRVGKVRIIFEKHSEENVIHDIGFRGDIY